MRRGSSKYRGVRWHERNGRWEARIFDNSTGKQISLGYYEAEEEAARAYDAESIRIRGIHAHVNLRAPSAARPRRTRRRAASKGVILVFLLTSDRQGYESGALFSFPECSLYLCNHLA